MAQQVFFLSVRVVREELRGLFSKVPLRFTIAEVVNSSLYAP